MKCGPFLFSTNTSFYLPLGLHECQCVLSHSVLFSPRTALCVDNAVLCKWTHSRTFDSKGANSRVLHLLVTNYTSFGFTRGKFKNITEERQMV